MPSLGNLVWLLRRDLKRGPSASYHFWRTLPNPPQQLDLWPSLPKAAVPIHVLTGREQLPLTFWMLASLSAVSGLRWQVVIHDDGTLTPEDCEKIRTTIPSARTITAAESDSVMNKALADYPNCANYRATHPLARKCFDIPHFAEEERFFLIDSDVLFFSRPEEMLQWGEKSDKSCWFNQDPQEPSPVSPSSAPSVFGSPLWPRVNSGLCFLTRQATSDLDFYESCLGVRELRHAALWRIEQMLLGLGASKVGIGGILPASYEVSLGRDRSPDAIARHYVGKVRDRFYAEGLAQLRHRLQKPS